MILLELFQLKIKMNSFYYNQISFQVMSSFQPPVMFSTDDYPIPQWGALPQFEFYFEVLKQGSIVGTIPIKRKQFSLIGRLQDLCDIFIDNPTVSRKHAILQFQIQDPLPLIYDLASAQGTFANKQKIPPKVYKKIELFANLKFGTSSRYYILRCPELEKKITQDEEQKQNDFLKTLNQQKKMLSKQEAKKKYLQLLQSDPFVGGQLKPRKLQGKQKNQVQRLKQQEGITWGIEDQNQVYSYKNQRDFPIEPDLLRRLPGLDQIMLDKISEYEQKFRIYDEIESQLNQLVNKQKRQFGLQEKLQNKKERLQKKFVESLEALEKSEDWIRINLFGDENSIHNNKNKKKQKERDTFSDDQFYDRTLQNKSKKKDGDQSQGILNLLGKQQVTIEDLWILKKNYMSELEKKNQLTRMEENFIKQVEIEQINETDKKQKVDEQDQLQIFMKQNIQNLHQQNKKIRAKEIQLVQRNLRQLKQKLIRFLSEKQLTKIQDEIINPQKTKERQVRRQKKQQQQKDQLERTLKRLQEKESLRRKEKLKRQILQKQCQDQYSQKLFELYKLQYSQEQNRTQDQNQRYQYRLRQPEAEEQQKHQHLRPIKKIHTNQNIDSFNDNQLYNPIQQQKSLQQNAVDLTKKFI